MLIKNGNVEMSQHVIGKNYFYILIFLNLYIV